MVLEILVSVTVVSSIGTGLAALLSICDHFLANYGLCQININDESNITVKGGIAGGSGMAPIKCILHYMKNTSNNRKATYYFGANKVSELFLLDRMKEFESDLADFKFVPVVAGQVIRGGQTHY